VYATGDFDVAVGGDDGLGIMAGTGEPTTSEIEFDRRPKPTQQAGYARMTRRSISVCEQDKNQFLIELNCRIRTLHLRPLLRQL